MYLYQSKVFPYTDQTNTLAAEVNNCLDFPCMDKRDLHLAAGITIKLKK